jgi:hypothetical protein
MPRSINSIGAITQNKPCQSGRPGDDAARGTQPISRQIAPLEASIGSIPEAASSAAPLHTTMETITDLTAAACHRPSHWLRFSRIWPRGNKSGRGLMPVPLTHDADGPQRCQSSRTLISSGLMDEAATNNNN